MRNLRTLIAVAAATALLVAPATVWAINVFTDVPDSNVFHDDITWLQEAGVTLGCNPPANTQYCPSDNVTREQMSAFMRRLAENQVVDAATAINAGTATNAGDADLLDGLDSTEIATYVWAQNDGDGSGVSETAAGIVEVNSIPIVAPTDGVLVISGSTYLNPGAANDWVIEPQVDGNPVVAGADIGEPGWPALFNNPGNEVFTFSYTVTVPVSAGSHTVSQGVGPYFGTADFFHNKEHLTVTFHPAGETSTKLSGAASNDKNGLGE